MSEPGVVRDKNRVRIFDTTLRDGEQAPGIALRDAEKVEIAEQLARLQVDILVVGRLHGEVLDPTGSISSQGEFEAVGDIADGVHGPVIARQRNRAIDGSV